jgi:hypothetical protein
MNIFYVYAYLDPRNQGKFKYEDIEFDYEPFYIGKGKNSRMLRHLDPNNEHNQLKKNKIKKIIGDGLTPIIIKIKDGMSNTDALDLEIKLIKTIGRKIRNSGPLLNFSKGGETFLGYKHKEDFKKKLNKRVIKYDLEGNKLEEYESVIEKSINEVFPHHIATYLFELAQVFNSLYEKERIIGSDREGQKVRLVNAYSQVLKNGLSILGISAPESM